MTCYHSPDLIVLWPDSSPAVSNIGGELAARFPMEQHSIFLPTELAAATGAEIRGGHFHSLTGMPVRLYEWRDPLQEHDLIMLTCQGGFYGNVTQECRDILNIVSPNVIDRVITFVNKHNPELKDPDVRVSVAAAREDDLAKLDRHVKVFEDGHLHGPQGVLLGVATEYDLSAYCIVVESSVDSVFVSPDVMNEMLVTFERLTEIELRRGRLSEQAIRIQKHLKTLSRKQEKKVNESVEDQMRNDENIQLIERLFAEARSNPSQARRLKSELDRLELYPTFEDRFLDLFSNPKPK